jgi:hypothetical protein
VGASRVTRCGRPAASRGLERGQPHRVRHVIPAPVRPGHPD